MSKDQSTDPAEKLPKEIEERIEAVYNKGSEHTHLKMAAIFGYSLAAERIKELEAEVKRLAYLADYWQEKKK